VVFRGCLLWINWSSSSLLSFPLRGSFSIPFGWNHIFPREHGSCAIVVSHNPFGLVPLGFSEEPRRSKIRARVFPADLYPKLLAILLGEMHVAGKDEWSAFEQAAYVYGMNVDMGFCLEDIAANLRASKGTVKKLLDAYKLMSDEFLVKYPAPQNVSKCSYFEEFYKKIKKPDRELELEFVDWVGKGKINEGMQVRHLPDILKHPAAKKALAESGHSASMHVLEAVDPSYTSKFFGAVDWMVEEFKKAPAEDIQAVREGDNARIEKLKSLHKALQGFAQIAGLNLDEKKKS
jgi:hypothetical protein